MLLGSMCMADTAITLFKVHTIQRDEKDTAKIQHRYELHLRHLPTGESEIIVYAHEQEAICSFAAWILAGETQDSLHVLRKNLRGRVKKAKFLP